MEFMTANDVTGRSERTIRKQPRFAVTEMQFALGKARRVAEQSGHGVAPPGRILNAFAQHHVAAAFAVNRPRLGEAPKPGLEAMRGGERICMQLRIATRQPAIVAAFGRRLVGKR